MIEYAENPDKTTAREYLEEDLYNAIRYAENDDKTDQHIYVDTINCSKRNAYAEMVAVQKRFGSRGETIAWHGFQSFAEGEVTPDEAFEIGKETARRMWGDQYQVVVTVHLNTDNLHCHFVVNPISFIDGSRFQNKIYNHRRLREISDEVCRERGKSVLEDSYFYCGEHRREYYRHQSGKALHRDMVVIDVEECLKYSDSLEMFFAQMKSRGYTVDKTRMSVRAEGWQRNVRLSSIGFSKEDIRRILERNHNDADFSIIVRGHTPYKPKTYPLLRVMNQLDFTISHSHDTATVLVDAVLLMVIMTIQLLHELKDVILLSPEMRHLERDLEQYVFDHRFMQKNDLHSLKQLNDYITATQKQINELEHERGLLRNKIRHEKSPEVKAENREQRQKITEHITPLRKDLKRAKRIMEQSPHLYDLIKQEHALEIQARAKNREYSR